MWASGVECEEQGGMRREGDPSVESVPWRPPFKLSRLSAADTTDPYFFAVAAPESGRRSVLVVLFRAHTLGFKYPAFKFTFQGRRSRAKGHL